VEGEVGFDSACVGLFFVEGLFIGTASTAELCPDFGEEREEGELFFSDLGEFKEEIGVDDLIGEAIVVVEVAAFEFVVGEKEVPNVRGDVVERYFGEAVDRLVLGGFLIFAQLARLVDQRLFLFVGEMGVDRFEPFFLCRLFFFLELGIGAQDERDKMGVVEEVAADDAGEVGGILESIGEFFEEGVDLEGVFRFVSMLLDEAGSHEEGEAEGASFAADFGPLEFELMKSGFEAGLIKRFCDELAECVKDDRFEFFHVLRLASFADEGEGHFAHFNVDRGFGFMAEARFEEGELERGDVGFHQEGFDEAEG
jgi:hypothetical protein